MSTLIQDLRYGLRMLAKNPGFSAVAILTLALGIGANSAIFGVINAVLLNSLPYADADRLVVVWEQQPERGWFHNVISAANFVDWRKQNHVFSGMAAIDESAFDVGGAGQPLEVPGEQVSTDLFRVLDARAAVGRTFTAEEDQPGGPRVVVLGNRLWKERYGSDRGLVGHEISINHLQFTVIGIMPPDFYFPPWGDRAELWTAGLDLSRPERTWHNYASVARLKPGVTLERAQAEISTIARRLEQEHPEQKGWGVQVVNLHQQVVGNTRPALLVLLGAVGMVLLIACANIANLQLARVASREREVALRSALGAGRARVARQLLTESVLISLVGGGVGLWLAGWGVKLLVAFAPHDTPGLGQARVDPVVLAFTAVVSIATGIVFGLAPALWASKLDVSDCLKETGRGTTHGSRDHRLRGILVTAEFALALILLAGAGLLLKTFAALRQVELGFDPHHVLTMRIALLGPGYSERSRQVRFFRNLLQKVEALPGIDSAAVIDGGGLGPEGGNGDGFLIVGRPIPPPNQTPDAVYRVISPEYFHVMRVPLVRGRYFSEADNADAPRVAIISEKLARDYWPDRDPLGSQLEFPGADANAPGALKKQPTRFSIVGVVKDMKNRGLEVPSDDEVYVPYSQYPTFYTPRTLVVRSSADPAMILSAIRQEVTSLDPQQPISDVKMMDEVIDQARAGHRFPMVLLGIFAGLALVLAAVGIYGVISYSVAQRTHEIGIRMALGAQQNDVLRAVLRQGMHLAAWGVGLGLFGALLATRSLSGLLYGVRPADPLTFLAVGFTLAAVGALSTYLPARRATKVDPMVALRHE